MILESGNWWIVIRFTAVTIQSKLNREELEQLLSVSLAVITQTNHQLNYDIASCKNMAKQVALKAKQFPFQSRHAVVELEIV